MPSQYNRTREEKCRRLVDKIIEIFDKGLALDPGAMHYIDTTFSFPSIEELLRIFSRDADSESDSAIVLVFSPDERFCERIEDLVQVLDFDKSDEAAILADVTSRRIVTTVFLPEGRGSLRLAMPPDLARQFVSGLNITTKIDASLIEAIEKFIEPTRQRLCRVKLRHARFNPAAEKKSFLCLFFEFVQKDEDWLRRFEFILNFLTEVPDGGDVSAALMRRKRFYIKNLQRVLAIEEQTRGKNMETMIQQGLQVPHINKRDVSRKIRWIDEISLAVFGKTDYFGAPGASVSIEVGRPDQDIGDISKILS